MISLPYPEPHFRIRSLQGKKLIFDPIRKKYVSLSPEEWVRQNLICYLLEVKHYPASLMSVEKEVRLGELKKRCDIVVYDHSTHPWMIIECKEMEVEIDQAVLDQVIRYHMSTPVKYLVMTNGTTTYCALLDPAKGHRFLDKIPDFE